MDQPKPRQKMVVKWEHDIKNPENEEYVNEVAFNLGKKIKKVTQDEFNQRYGIKKDAEYYDIKAPKKIKLRIKKKS